MTRDRSRKTEAVRITTAASSRNADIAARQKRYLLSMAVRTACFVGAIVVDGVLRWVLIVAALVLPYVAVVMANVSAARSDGFALQDGEFGHPELNAGATSEPDSGPDRR